MPASLDEILSGESNGGPALSPATSLGARLGELEGIRWRDYHTKQNEFVVSKAKRKVVRVGRRGGKAQPLDAILWTRKGPIRMGDVQVGTEIAAPNGWSTVEGIYPQGVQDVYRVTVSGGASTECTDDHLWSVRTNQKGDRRSSSSIRKPRVLKTSELRKMSRADLRRMSVPRPDPVEFREQEVPLDPYLLGILIGDGGLASRSATRISTSDEFILREVRNALPDGYVAKHVVGYDYAISRGQHTGGRPSEALSALKSLGLQGLRSREKFIPSAYLYNSRSVRLALLQGLLDSGGYVDMHGQPRFDQTSYRLADDFEILVVSLGGFVRRHEKCNARKGARCSYVVYPDARELFRLPRKKAKARPRRHSINRKLQSIEWSRRAEAQCIKIADERGVYLTDGMIATHNTTAAGGIAARYFLDGARVLYGGPTKEQLDQFWSEVKWILDAPLSAGVWHKNESQHIIEMLGTKQRIKAKTVWIPDDIRGDNCDLLILDEFQMMSEAVWEVVAQPMLIDNDGDAVFCFTVPSILSRSQSKARDKLHASKLFKKHEKDGPDSDWECFTFSSHENPFVSAAGIARISEDMTSMAYRQEILAEDPDEVPGALWTHNLIDKGRVKIGKEPDPMVRVAVGVDPPGGATECGIVVVGIAPKVNKKTGETEMHAYVLSDASLRGSPRRWAKKAISQYNGWDADRIIAEINFGGDMVESTIRTQDTTVPVFTVHASRGKAVRAEPVAALYEGSPKVHHVGRLRKLEEEMCSWIPGEPNQSSPNRMDALVWAIWYLLLRKKRKVVWGHSKAVGKEASK